MVRSCGEGRGEEGRGGRRGEGGEGREERGGGKGSFSCCRAVHVWNDWQPQRSLSDVSLY
eukprot:765491-Hanusia_phi.AAC.6